MSEAIYQTLAKVLDTLPNGFPATESGVKIKLLKMGHHTRGRFQPLYIERKRYSDFADFGR